MKIFCIFTIFLMILSYFTVMPCQRKPVDTGIYIAKEKIKDKLYLDQFEKLENCIKNFNPLDQILKNDIKKLWIDNAYYDLIQIFNNLNKNIFNRKKYIDCIEIVAEKKAAAFVCNHSKVSPLRFDHIIHYALLEYEICVEQKNKANPFPITFDRPKIGPEDIN